jgi:hypothetical protein
VIAFGVVAEAATGTPVGGAVVAMNLGGLAAADISEPCSVPSQRAADAPRPVTADQLGRYRIEVLSTAREPRCLFLEARRGAEELTGLAEARVRFGPPGAVDSVRVDIALPGR